MSKIFEDTMTGLLQAICIEQGYISVKEITNMPAPTYRAVDPLHNLYTNDGQNMPKKAEICQNTDLPPKP